MIRPSTDGHHRYRPVGRAAGLFILFDRDGFWWARASSGLNRI